MFMEFEDFKINEETQFAVLGLGQFGKSIVKVLSENNYHVLGCDNDPLQVHEVSQYATHVVQADITDETVLDELGIGNFDVVVVAHGSDFESSIITTMIAKENNVPFIVAKASHLRQKKILESVGANWVVLPEIEMGEKVAHHLITENPMRYIDQSEHYEIVEISPEPNWMNKTISQLDLIKTQSIIILVILREDEVLAIVDPDTKILPDDKLVILRLT